LSFTFGKEKSGSLISSESGKELNGDDSGECFSL